MVAAAGHFRQRLRRWLHRVLEAYPGAVVGAVAIISIMAVGSYWVVKYSMKSLDLYAARGGLAESNKRSQARFPTQ